MTNPHLIRVGKSLQGQEGFSQPYLESPTLSGNLKEENNNDLDKKKKFKLTRFNTSIKRNADSFVTPTLSKKIKTSNDFTSEDDSNSSTENLLIPSDMCRRRSWRRNSSQTMDYLESGLISVI